MLQFVAGSDQHEIMSPQKAKKEVQDELTWQDTSNSHWLKFLPVSAKHTNLLTTAKPALSILFSSVIQPFQLYLDLICF